jgi:hypothetical protein
MSKTPKVVAGRLIPVENKNRFPNAKTKYISVWVEDADGSNERCLLLTENELKNIEYRSRRNKEDHTKKSRLTDLFD